MRLTTKCVTNYRFITYSNLCRTHIKVKTCSIVENYSVINDCRFRFVLGRSFVWPFSFHIALIIIIRVVFDHTIYSAFLYFFVSLVLVLLGFVSLSRPSQLLNFKFSIVKMHEQKQQNICHSNIRFDFFSSLSTWIESFVAGAAGQNVIHLGAGGELLLGGKRGRLWVLRNASRVVFVSENWKVYNRRCGGSFHRIDKRRWAETSDDLAQIN